MAAPTVRGNSFAAVILFPAHQALATSHQALKKPPAGGFFYRLTTNDDKNIGITSAA